MQAVFATVVTHSGVTIGIALGPGPVDDHGHGLVQGQEGLMRQSEIMEAEGRGVGHQQDQIHITGDRDRRTADPGRRIEDGIGRDLSQHGVQTGPQLAQQGRRHGFADTGTPHEEADRTVQHRAVFQFAQLPAHGLEGLVRTDGETAAERC